MLKFISLYHLIIVRSCSWGKLTGGYETDPLADMVVFTKKMVVPELRIVKHKEVVCKYHCSCGDQGRIIEHAASKDLKELSAF